MKWILAISLLPLSISAAELTINVNNVRVQKGQISLAICADEICHNNIDEENTPNPPLDLKIQAVKNVTTTIVTDLAPGEYSIWFYHDVNENGIADRGFLGKPKEPFGVSNLEKFPLSKPAWKKSKFEVTADGTIVELKLIDP
jgi:uncharacterized protein (DUF2141 family)